jgi:hypothetical protein
VHCVPVRRYSVQKLLRDEYDYKCRRLSSRPEKQNKAGQNVMIGQNWGFVSLGLCVPIDELRELFFMHFCDSFNSLGFGVILPFRHS